jgi:hypothetical protein
MVVIIAKNLLPKCIGQAGSRLWHPGGGQSCGFVVGGCFL